jgi:DNA-binding SARP family transcriptional activator/class 3 adenylate cyclase/DNA-binding CsgD family transcriptional regulator
MDFRVLGPLEAREGGRIVPLGGGKERSLLGVLLLHANETVSVDRLVDELWGERPPARATKLVQGYVSALRKRLGPDRLVTGPRGYAVRVEPSELDSVEFERLVAQAHTKPPEGAARCLREALAFWRGPALAGVRLEGFAASEAEHLNELRLAGLLDRIDADLALGRHEELVGELEALIAEHPLRERLRGQLMLALYRAGRQAEALEVYRRTRRVLIEELGIEPSVQLQSLEEAILNQDPTLVGHPSGAERTSPVLQLPRPLRLIPPYPFVGRTRELATLRSLVPRATGEGRRIALIGGEAGSGKSRLVREFAHEVAAEGVLVLYGACDAVVRTPYRPVVEALDHLVRVTEIDSLRADLGPTGGELTRLLPDLVARVGELRDPIRADPDTERHRLHTAVSDLLANVSCRRPLLLVLEDGHWADTPTLLLLRHLGRAATDARVLVLATFRDTEAEVPAELADALTELRRSDDVIRIRLGGLSERESADFVRSAAGATTGITSGLAQAVRDLTEGNPFLLCELWRTLAETEAVEIVEGTVRLTRPVEEIATPESVREVVRQRLSRLPPATRELLDLASVVGTEFDLEILRRAVPVPAQAPTGTVTFLFTDIEGSTALVRRLGERYPELLATHNRLLANAFDRWGGHEVDRQGDALFFTFRRARDAVQAAVDAQRSVAGSSFPKGAHVRVRIGIHTGEPGVAATGYHGLGVVKAARTSGAAHGGQILVSAATWALLGDEPISGIILEDLGEYRLKGFDQPERIYQVVADGLERRFAPLRAGRDETLEQSAHTDEVAAERRRGEQPLASARGLNDTTSHAPRELFTPDGNLSALAGLEPAERSGMIEEIPSRRLAYRFTHELIRRALYDQLSGPRRAELHLRIGEVLEATHRPPSARVLADLALHFSVAAPLGERERAVEYNLLAAQAAAAVLAYDEAAARLRTALELGIDDERRQTEVWLELGAAWFQGGRSLESIQAYREAAELARRVSDGGLLAHAAVGLEKACWRPQITDAGAVELLEEACAALADDDSGLRILLLAGLTRAQALSGDRSRAAVVGASAIEMAHRIDDHTGLATALLHTACAHGGSTLDVEMLTEAQDLAVETGDVEIHADATAIKLAALAQRGEIEALRAQLAEAIDVAHRVRQPYFLHATEQHRSALALLEGRFEAAERAAERSRDWGGLLTGADPSGDYGIQMFGIRREQGRLNEVASAMRLVAGGDETGTWQPALAALLVELGQEEDVERELAKLRRQGLDRLRGPLWIASLTYLTDACSAAGDKAVAALIYPELAWLAGTNIVIGYSVAYYGAADRYLGMLAATVGDVDRAQLHFAAALDLNRRMGATTWLAHTYYEYGRLLHGNGERRRAEPLFAEATALAQRVEANAILARVRALGEARRPAPPLVNGLSAREADVLRLVAKGLSNREIGAALSISEHTAANHVRTILRKTGCTNRTEAASYAHRRGLVGS